MSEPVTAATAAASAEELVLRTRIDRALGANYELDREMGRGGMGIVYRARDRRLKRHVAIKILPPELAFRQEIRSRFLREAETAAQLSHPHIVPIYSVDEADGIVYFVMACVEGDNLGKRLHDRGPLPVEDVRRILAEVADALAYAHARGVVHRDIKPDNILLDRDGDRAMVSDFGIARAIIEGSDSRLTATGMAIGTPAYMSPEQAAGDREIDGRSDLYALGVLGYQMLAGELPFQATSTPALLIKHLSERPVPVDQRRPGVPPDLAAAVMRLLEKEPDRRFSTAAELETALLERTTPVTAQSFATTQPPLAAPLPPMGAPGRAPERAPSAAPQLPDWLTGPARERPTEAFGGLRGVDAPRPFAGPTAALPGIGGPAGLMRSDADTGDVEPASATADEMARWKSPRVIAFRRKLGWYAIVGSMLLLVSLFGNSDFFGFLGLWTVYIAFKYAKLWGDGYSWHDVLRQPRERLFADVASEWADDVQAIFDPVKRARVRERARRRRLRPGAGGYAPFDAGRDARDYTPPYAALSAAAPNASVPAGEFAERVHQAFADRDEVQRLLQTMPNGERARVADAGPAAEQLAARVLGLANRLGELDRDATPGAAEVLEAEISRLEGEANPLDRAASDGRVKRLAYLKRQRRGITDRARQREAARGALERSGLALQGLRLDLVRLRTGGGTPAQVTTLAERAMGLAREIDGIVAAAGEAARATAPRGGPGSEPIPEAPTGLPLGAGSTPARA